MDEYVKGPGKGPAPFSTVSSPDNTLQDSTILIVDDQELNRELLKGLLRKGGYNNVQTAADGLEALNAIAVAPPDLVILDIVMPRLDGFTVCRQLRQDNQFKDLPIIVQTALDGTDERYRVFESGASDMIIKPFDNQEILSRVKLHLQQRHDQLLNQKHMRQMEKELQQARHLQQCLLPAADELQEIESKTGLCCRNHYESSTQLGGDLWGISRLNDNSVLVYTADFVGHGVAAAMDTFRLHTLMKMAQERGDRIDPAQTLTWLNKQLHRTMSTGQFATMFICVLDPAGGTLRYASAAAPSPFQLSAGGPVEELTTTGHLLGIRPHTTYSNLERPFLPGDCLFIYSDALIESRNGNGERTFGTEQWKEYLTKLWPDCGLDGLMEVSLGHFFDQHPRPLDDDLTVVALSYPA